MCLVGWVFGDSMGFLRVFCFVLYRVGVLGVGVCVCCFVFVGWFVFGFGFCYLLSQGVRAGCFCIFLFSCVLVWCMFSICFIFL